MDEILAQINKRFDEIDRLLKWVIRLELLVLGEILVLIVKMFFFDDP